jgi:hypothetical protein
MNNSDKKLIERSIILKDIRMFGDAMEVELDITETVNIIQSRRPELTKDEIVAEIKRLCEEKGLPVHGQV